MPRPYNVPSSERAAGRFEHHHAQSLKGTHFMRSPFTRSTRAILALTLAATTLGCQRELVPPPYIMRGEAGRAQYAEVDPAFQKADMPILYVTDRSCDKVGDCGPEYGYERSRTVDYGVATIGLSPEPTWDQLVIDSTKNAESQPYNLRVKSVEVVGHFQDAITRYDIEDGKFSITEENLSSIRQERMNFCSLVDRWLDHSQSKDAFVYVHGFNNTFESERPSQYSALARNTTRRGTASGMTMLSMKDRWLLARITGPVAGMCSRPTRTGLQSTRKSSRTTMRVSA
jgi:hypothetical protein